MSLYHCLNCQTPIKLDDTLNNLSKAQTDLIIKKATQAPKVPLASPSKFIPQDRLNLLEEAINESGDATHYSNESNLTQEKPLSYDSKHSYVYVHDHEEDPGMEKEHPSSTTTEQEEQLPDFSRIKSLGLVFDILSHNQDVSHPMSAECAQLLINNYKFKFDQSQREKEYYISFLKKLRERERNFSTRAEADTDAKLAETAHELELLHALEQSKLEELEDLEKTHGDLQSQLRELDEELHTLNTERLDEVLLLKNTLTMDLSQKQNHLDHMKALYQKQLDHLDSLRTLNIFNRLFQILFEGEESYGRINGFRLGYKVPWPEVNAALGQVAHLLTFLMKRLDLRVDGYKIVAMGSKSYLVKTSKHTTEEGNSRSSSILQLHSTNEFTLGKLFNFNKLDVSMIALLDIASQVEAKVIELDEEFELPYPIAPNHDKIGGKSIRVTLSNRWTEACRFLLTDLAWMLTFVSARAELSNK